MAVQACNKFSVPESFLHLWLFLAQDLWVSCVSFTYVLILLGNSPLNKPGTPELLLLWVRGDFMCVGKGLLMRASC